MKKERMGFESNRRLRRQYNNQPEEKYGCKFKSKFERRYADYLEIMKAAGYIVKWEYEPVTFIFPNVTSAPVQYTPDFRVYLSNDDIEYHEVKGYAEGKDTSKMRRMAEHYPDTIMVFIMMSVDNRSGRVNRYRNIKKYTKNHEIKYMAPAFRKLGIK